MLRGAQRQGLQAAMGEEAREGIEDAAHGVVQETQTVGQIGVLAHHRGAADQVGMPAHIFRHRMDDDVNAEFNRPLHGGRREGVVGHGQDAALLRNLRDGIEIGHFQQRVAGRLDPDHFRLRRDGGLNRRRIRSIDMRHRQIGRAFPHAMEQPPGSAVQIARRDDMAAMIEQFKDRRLRRQSRSESEAANAAFQIRHRRFEGGARRIARPRILPACVLAGRGLDESRGGEDRLDHRAGGGIGVLVAVNGACGKTMRRRIGHRSVHFQAKVVDDIHPVMMPRKCGPSTTTAT